MNSKVLSILLILLVVSVGVNAYYLFLELKPENGVTTPEYQRLREEYPYLSQKVLTEYNRDILINFFDLRHELDRIVKPYEDSFGLYFEYLPTGASIRTNEDAEFYAASLVKVPIVMAYYHKQNRLGEPIDQEVTLTQDDINTKYGDLWKRGAGTKMQMKDLIRFALADSDNTAGDAILHRISEEDFLKVYEGLDITLEVENEETIMTAEQYASVLKSLYYASILPIESSNEILSLLATSKFQDKLPAGVPNNVKIAHKVGILGETLYQDCGIVYLPRRPYLLCMISNSDEKTATERMSTISKAVYSFVSSANAH